MPAQRRMKRCLGLKFTGTSERKQTKEAELKIHSLMSAWKCGIEYHLAEDLVCCCILGKIRRDQNNDYVNSTENTGITHILTELL